MEITYKVEAKSNTTNGMNVEIKGFRDIEGAFECADTLETAFPMVDVINEYTGEVMYSHYVAVDFFHPVCEMGKAIFLAECNRCF